MAPTLGGTLRFEDEEMERMLIAERFASSYVTTQIGLFINSCACVAFMFRVDDGAKRARLAVLVVGFVVIIIVRAWLERYEDRVLAHRCWSFASAVFVLTALPLASYMSPVPNMDPVFIVGIDLMTIAICRQAVMPLVPRVLMHAGLMIADMAGDRVLTAGAVLFGEIVGFVLEREVREEFKRHYRYAKRLSAFESDSVGRHSASDTVGGPGVTTGSEDITGVALIERVGRGGYSSVWRASWASEVVAVKVLEQQLHPQSAGALPARVRREAEYLKRLRHPCICSFFGTCTLPGGSSGLLLEFLAGGTLSDFLGIGRESMAVGSAPEEYREADNRHWQALPSSQLLQLARDVASGLSFLHANGIVHRDVKTANCMLDVSSPPRVKLCDFGISQPHRQAPSAVTDESAAAREGVNNWSLSMGSPRYQPPEVSKGHGTTTVETKARASETPADVYSYALLLYEILHGRMAFAEMNALAAMIRASQGARPRLAPRPEHGHLIPLIEGCWHSDPGGRPSMPSVVDVLMKEFLGSCMPTPS